MSLGQLRPITMTKPEKTFKAGAVRASVFMNTVQRGGEEVPIRKVAVEVRYRGKDGQWKGTSSLSLNEIPKAITALQQAYEYLLSQSGDAGPSPDDTPKPANDYGPVR